VSKTLTFRVTAVEALAAVTDPGETNDDLVRDMIEVLTGFCVRLHGRRGARNRALRAVTCAKQPPGAGPVGGGQDD
jgi:predicted site-specific integrase-resolvase